MVYIDAVHYEQDEYGNEYIARMKWTNYLTTQATDECNKRQMIDFINKNPNTHKNEVLSLWSLDCWRRCSCC